MNSDAVIEVRGLHVRFGKQRVLEGVDLEVARGSVTALVGSNGVGKSTLLRVLVGALVPDGGSSRVLGLDPAREGAQVRARVGYVADRFEVSRGTRGGDWLAFVARFYATWSAAEERRLCELLRLDASERVDAMSKGARAKLALVAALAHQPALVLLDEPFSGLDVPARRAISTGLLGHLRDQDRTVLLVSHSITDVERVADRVAHMAGGRVVRVAELEPFAASARGGVDLESALLRAERVEVKA